MIKPAYLNIEVECWVDPGRQGLFRPTLCLFHDSTGAGGPILDALIELQKEARPARRTLTFAAPRRQRAVRTLKLMTLPAGDDLMVMSIRCHAESATIEMTDVGLCLVIRAVESWLTGSEDFGVSPLHANRKPKELGSRDRASGELWFWGPSMEP